MPRRESGTSVTTPMSMAIMLMVQVLMAIALIALILIQRGRGADTGAAFGSGASTTVFGARGSASFLTRTTSVLAILFFSNCFVLSFLAGKSVKAPTSVMDTVTAPKPAAGKAAAAGSASGAETGASGDSVQVGANDGLSEIPDLPGKGTGEVPEAKVAAPPAPQPPSAPEN